MSKLIASSVTSLLLLVGLNELVLSTDYQSGLNLRVEESTSLHMETTAFEVLRNGEPMDMGDYGTGGSSDERTIVTVERVLEATDGSPTKVRREFVSVEGSRSSEARGEQLYLCELDGVTLELSVEDDDLTIEVVEGEEPDDEAVLEGHRLGLLTDALLPEDSVESGQTWELDADQVRRVLGVDLNNAMFARDPNAEGGGRFGGGGGGRGQRGPRGGGGGSFGLLRNAEWTATATLTAVDEEVDGETCARIEFTLEAEGALPEREPGGGRPRMFGPANTRPLESTYEIELKGFLLFSVDSRLPVRLELEGTLGTDTNTIRERGEMTIEVQREEVGTLERTVEFTSVEDDA